MSDANINIQVINVKDGDAIIVYLRKPGADLLMLIDGGHAGDADIVLHELEPFLKKTGKLAPDLIVCTHYDSDHIGGLDKIIRHFKKDIGHVWIHETSQVLDIIELPIEPSQGSNGILPSDTDQLIGSSSFFMDMASENGMQQLLQSIKQERELIAFIKEAGIPFTEPIAQGCSLPGWEEIEVLGPTRKYYQKLFPKRFNVKKYLQDEIGVPPLIHARKKAVAGNPCLSLDNTPKSGVTATNLNSAIIKIIVSGRSYLFTGDAGVGSFKNVVNYQEKLKNIYWLKVPHHGSAKNLNSSLIALMSPSIAVISGNARIDDGVVGCFLNKNARVDTTRENGTLVYNG